MNENFLHPEILRKDGRAIELDIFLPTERLAFEYQGELHHHDIYSLGDRWKQKQLDAEKRIACEAKQITLVEVPYWWDFKKPSLVATIQNHRDDLLLNEATGLAIPLPKEGTSSF